MIWPNDWHINKCLYLSISFLLSTAGIVGLANFGLDIPLLRQFVGFIFLTFIPGLLILRILRIHNIGITDGLVYSAGLSLAFIMFAGAAINFVLPLLGVSRPISLLPVTATLATLTLILMAITYLRDRRFMPRNQVEQREKIYLPAVLSLLLLLLLTILAVFLIDAYQDNTLLLICLVAICVVIALAAFGRFIQRNIYPLAIFIISLCLLYQTTLMSPYLIGTDIHTEYRFYRMVADNGLWDAAIPNAVNSCLSITILAPVYSLLLNIDGVWVFKAIYPLLFSLVPLVLFHIFSQQISQRKAFLATLFFMAVPTFMLEMIALCRQQIAELFLVLLILVLVDRKLASAARSTLAIVFAVSAIVSHYALGIIGFIYMGLFLPFVLLLRSGFFQKAWGRLTRRFGGLPQSLLSKQPTSARLLTTLVIIYFVAGFLWYGTIASGVNLSLANRLWNINMAIITTELARLPAQPAQSPDPQSKPIQPPAFFQFSNRDVLIQTALGLDFLQASPQGKVFRILQYMTQLFLIAGCIRLIFRPKGLGFTTEYMALSLTSALLIAACIFLPKFADPLNTTRMYHIALITLAPFCILGGEGIWLGISSLWRKTKQVVRSFSRARTYNRPRHEGGDEAAEVPGFSLCTNEEGRAFLRFMALAVLVPYFLLTSGFVYEATKQDVTDKIDIPYSIALSSYRLDLAGVFYWQDGAAARWLAQQANDKTKVYADAHTAMFLSDHLPQGEVLIFPHDASKLSEDSYIYLSARNIAKGELTFVVYQRPELPTPGLRQSLSFADVPGLITAINGKNRIYNNGGAQILAPR